jgi:tRNA-Thr(GGU) m(6)t(6)A37 methyltransferase TsaA
MPATASLARVALPSLGILALTLRLLYQLHRRAESLRVELAQTKRLRQEERTGRTTAERRLREQQQLLQQLAQDGSSGEVRATASELPAKPHVQEGAASPSLLAFTYKPIGRLSSCYVERRGTPRQGLLAPAARARLRIDPRVIQPEAAIDGLAAFSHVWLLFDFHENTNATKLASSGKGKLANKVPQLRAKVHPPGMAGKSIGLFATRTPHRPNPIGLSVARLIAVEGDTLVLGGADLIDGTPILDIKPYLGHDVQRDASVPSWCENRYDASMLTHVVFSDEAQAQLATAVKQGALRFYSDVATVTDAISQTLMLDIRSVHQGRGDEAEAQQYMCRFDTLTLNFTTVGTTVHVQSVLARSPNQPGDNCDK